MLRAKQLNGKVSTDRSIDRPWPWYGKPWVVGAENRGDISYIPTIREAVPRGFAPLLDNLQHKYIFRAYRRFQVFSMYVVTFSTAVFTPLQRLRIQ